jgi:hypothetical protein
MFSLKKLFNLIDVGGGLLFQSGVRAIWNLVPKTKQSYMQASFVLSLACDPHAALQKSP